MRVSNYQTNENFIDRLLTEADLCRNEGADDIAKLLDEASQEIGVLNSELASAHDILADNERFRAANAELIENTERIIADIRRKQP